MHRLSAYFRAYSRRKHVRPWALSVPILTLLICLPLLRPLRHPIASLMSDDEMARWGTVQALVEQQTFAIDRTQFATTRQRVSMGEAHYSDQPPVMGLLLSGPYWLLHRFGYSFSKNPSFVEYLLTLISVTLPVAAAGGMIYRMGRLFELPRPWRAALALIVILGSGLLTYATVLNPYAPAAALVLLSAAILVQVTIVNLPLHSGAYLISAGFFAALAAVIDPAAIVFTILLTSLILSIRWRWSARIAGILMYAIGMIPPVMLHISLSVPITGDWRLGLTHVPTQPFHILSVASLGKQRRIAALPPAVSAAPVTSAASRQADTDEDVAAAPPTAWQMGWVYASRIIAAFFGTHGLLTHYPVLLFGGIGLFSVIHRHWPSTTKSLAIVTAAGGSIVLLRYACMPVDWRWAMFGVRWYVVFLPLLLFWAGAWMRRDHHPLIWLTAAMLFVLSALVSILGATDPMPREGYRQYTVAAALRNLTTAITPDDLPEIAGR